MATMVREPHHLTFIHIPKTGGNSITTWLKTHFAVEITKGKQHATIEHTKQRLGEVGTTFCVVRNPWDYAVSWYTFKLMLAKVYIEQIKENPHMANNQKEKWNLELQQHHLKRLEQGFDPWIRGAKLKQQSRWADGCDIVLKLENINEDFKIIQQKLDCYEPLPFINKTKDRTFYRDYYTDETIELVRHKLKDDIETYNYEF